MSRYINGDKLLEYYEEQHRNLCKKNGETDAYCQGYEDAMYVAERIDFTADVVPRSEVERLKVEGGILEQECGKFMGRVASLEIELEAMRSAANSYKMHYENLVREIFEEIEFDIRQLDFDRDETRAIEGVIAELKKKYLPKGE